MQVIEQYRLTNHPVLGSDSSYGNNGFFIIPHQRISDYYYNCQVSDGEGWEHVSITLSKQKIFGKPKRQKTVPVERCCTWEEMCYIKHLFFHDEDSVMQLHPPKSQWVNNHPYCLHLWRPTIEVIPLPSTMMVGASELNSIENQTF